MDKDIGDIVDSLEILEHQKFHRIDFLCAKHQTFDPDHPEYGPFSVKYLGD